MAGSSSHISNKSRGSSLVTTLLVIVILTIIVTAFLQSMTAERQTSRSYLNRYRADLAAQSAASSAQNLMRWLFQNYPDSCTTWATLSQTRGTAFYFRKLKGGTTGALPKDHSPSIEIDALLLASGAVPVISSPDDPNGSQFDEAHVFPSTGTGSEAGLTTDNSVNLNRNGWIGGPIDKTTQEIRARWVDILENPALPRDDSIDTSTGRAKNGVVARYAFWIEDESFRLDVNETGDTPRQGDTRGVDPEEVDLQPAMDAAGTTNFAPALVSLRNSMPDKQFLSASQINFADGNGSKNTYDKLKFFVTDASGTLNLTRGGVKRLNINTVVSDTQDAETIRQQLDRIVAAIGNPYAIPSDSQHKSMSDFGQRFYLSGTKTASLLNGYSVDTSPSFNHADIYMQKLAANMRDFVDSDSQPTIVGNLNQIFDPSRYSSGDFPVKKAGKPNATDMIGFNPEGNGPDQSDTVAVGKEAVPGLNEYAYRVRLISMNPPSYTAANPSAQYELEDSHYFEFFNPTDKPIKVSDLYGKNANPAPFLLIANQLGYGTAGGTDIPAGRIIEIPLESFVDGNGQPLVEFPAGKAIVLTNDSNPEKSLAASGVNVASFYRPNSAAAEAIKSRRHFNGTTYDKLSSSPRMFRVMAQFGTSAGRTGSGGSDYDAQVMIGNGDGVIESFTALPLPAAGSLSIKYDNGATSPPSASAKWFQGGSLKGNANAIDVGTASGDPRSLNEQMSIYRYVSGRTEDITRFLTSGLDSGLPGTSTFGKFSNTYLNPPGWPDYAPTNIDSATTAYGRIANSKLDSIGRLGDVYDPSRRGNPSAAKSDVVYARGGGRTLRIGQAERWAGTSGTAAPVFGFWDGKQESVSRNRTAWRLTDIFSTTDAMELPGRININSVARDGGVAMKAALYKFKFGSTPTADAGLAGKDLNIDAFIDALKKRFPSSTSNDPRRDNPFWERGELSELQADAQQPASDGVFNAGTLITGTNMKNVLDRNREELVRRSVELLTTKGNVFRVYCIGESVAKNINGELRVMSRQRLKVTFAVEPIFDSTLPDDDKFDGLAELASGAAPSDAEAASKRFRQPDDYKIRVLSVNTL